MSNNDKWLDEVRGELSAHWKTIGKPLPGHKKGYNKGYSDGYLARATADRDKIAELIGDIDRHDTLLRRGLIYIKDAKRTHYPHTTNSYVDDWISDVEKLKEMGVKGE